MYGLNALALIFFYGINVLAYQLCKSSERSRSKAMCILCLILLFGNIMRYALLYPLFENSIRIPVEFSTVSYFVVPTILLIGRKSIRSWAAYSGLMAGFFYYMAMIIAGGPIYSTYPPYDIYISMFCHGALYICGFVTIGTQQYCEKEGYKLVLGVTYISARALLLRPLIVGSEKLLIFILLDGICVKQLLPENNWSVALPVYYILIIGLVMLTIKVFFRSNKTQYKKFTVLREQKAIQATI